jgi:hypothetical protein
MYKFSGMVGEKYKIHRVHNSTFRLRMNSPIKRNEHEGVTIKACD